MKPVFDLKQKPGTTSATSCWDTLAVRTTSLLETTPLLYPRFAGTMIYATVKEVVHMDQIGTGGTVS